MSCSSLLHPIDQEERCPSCVHLLAENEVICRQCINVSSPYVKKSTVFEHEGPAASLVQQLKGGNKPYLAKGMAAFLVAHLIRLGWPLPDALVPIPLSLDRKLLRGYNQSALLAKEMGTLLDCPVWHLLKRKGGDYSQSALSIEKRKVLDGRRFELKSTCHIQNKRLLVIDDVMVTGATLRVCGEVLETGHPAALYALSFSAFL